MLYVSPIPQRLSQTPLRLPENASGIFRRRPVKPACTQADHCPNYQRMLFAKPDRLLAHLTQNRPPRISDYSRLDEVTPLGKNPKRENIIIDPPAALVSYILIGTR